MRFRLIHISGWSIFWILSFCMLTSIQSWSQRPPIWQSTRFAKGGKLERPSQLRVKKFKAEAERALGRRVFAFQAGANPSDPTFSWKDKIPFNTNEDQGAHCGSCYIFAGVGALEESWAIGHPGKSIQASQQLVLNCTGTCSGGYVSTVFEFLINKGTTTAAGNPYTGIPAGCSFTLPMPYTAIAAEYIASDGGMPTENDLKTAILQYGPVATFIYAGGTFDSWFGRDESSVITDDSTGAINGHIVLITGWNDSLGAWEIKNSWGATWGENGFAYVKKNIRDLGDNAMWIVSSP
jgi:C1A family cysteine protease